MKKDFARILISREEIAEKIKEVAAQITEDYKGESVLFVCILRVVFTFIPTSLVR